MKKCNSKILFLSILGIFIANAFFGCSSVKLLINGNGKVRAQEISIGDYDKIVINNDFQYEYIHGADTSFLSIETDENLIPYFHCYVKNRTLYIDMKNPETGEVLTNYQLRSSKCLIRTGTTQLLQVIQAGASEFLIVNDFASSNFELIITGIPGRFL